MVRLWLKFLSLSSLQVTIYASSFYSSIYYFAVQGKLIHEIILSVEKDMISYLKFRDDGFEQSEFKYPWIIYPFVGRY